MKRIKRVAVIGFAGTVVAVAVTGIVVTRGIGSLLEDLGDAAWT